MNLVAYDESKELLKSIEKTIIEDHPFQKLLSNETAIFALAQLQADAIMDTELPDTDHRISLLCMNCFRLGAYMAHVNEGESLADQEQIKRCLNCKDLKIAGGTLRCRLDKCRYE